MVVFQFLSFHENVFDSFFGIIVVDKASVEHAAVPNQVKPLEALPLSTVSTNIEVKAALLQSTRARDVVVTNKDPESKRLYDITLSSFKNLNSYIIYVISNLPLPN